MMDYYYFIPLLPFFFFTRVLDLRTRDWDWGHAVARRVCYELLSQYYDTSTILYSTVHGPRVGITTSWTHWLWWMDGDGGGAGS